MQILSVEKGPYSGQNSIHTRTTFVQVAVYCEMKIWYYLNLKILKGKEVRYLR